jgi:hypothetical protein
VGHPAAHFGKEPAFDFGDAFIGGEHFGFIFLEFGRGETLSVDERLLALEIGRRKMQVGLGDLQIKTKDLVYRIFSEPMPVRLRSRSSIAAMVWRLVWLRSRKLSSSASNPRRITPGSDASAGGSSAMACSRRC